MRSPHSRLLPFASFVLAALAIDVARSEDFASLLKPGDSLASALAELNRRGFRVAYSSNVVLPDMRLKAAPRATQIEALLEEILAPWGLRALKAADNDFLVIPAQQRTANSVAQTAQASPLEAAPLQTIDVTATRFGIAGGRTDAATTLSAEDMQRIPHLADDAMRVLKTLPGIAGRDLSGRVNVRGGRRDEVLMLIDGAEIHNGFHFQDEDDGILSLVDTNLVAGMDVITGGMTADRGDAMSGVVEITTRRPSTEDQHRHAVGISFISSFARTSQTFAQGRGSWIATARRSYLDLLMEEVQDSDEQVTPEYQDAYGALRYELSDRTSLAAHVLLGTDDLKVVESDNDGTEAGAGESSHLWFTVDHAWTDSVDSTTVVSWATGDRQRDAFEERAGRVIGDVSSNAEFNYVDVRQDWNWLAGEDHLIKWGLSASRHDAKYDYLLHSLAIHPIDGTIVQRAEAIELDASGDKLGFFGAYRTRLTDAFALEAGARWDRYSYEHGSSYTRVSPRFNAVYELDDGSELRAAWGVMHQPHGVDAIDVQDGQTQIYEPERARHAVLGYTRPLFDTMSLRVDAYRKDYSDLRPRYDNELSSIRLIPEAEADRIRLDAKEARAQGVELTVRRDTREQWGGWLSYGYALAEEYEDGSWRPRGWEQQHTVNIGVGRSGATWDVNLAGFYHSGSPVTAVYLREVQSDEGPPRFVIERGAPNGSRAGHYLRFDLRASRKVFFEASVLTYYLEVFNLLDRQNPCCIDDIERRREADLVLSYNYGWPRLPSFGFQYEF